LAETGNFPDSVFVSGKNSVEFRNQQDNVDFSAIAAFRQDVKPSAPSRRVCRGARRWASSEPRHKLGSSPASAQILNDSKMIHLHSGALGAYSANIPASFCVISSN
jgi:hypothetical protein